MTIKTRQLNKISILILFIFCCLFFISCDDLKKAEPTPFYSETAPPPRKEFRWSNGKMPKSFDPALAAAPPETDIVRAIYEGLTDTDPKTLETTTALAINWSSTDDFKVWTFDLRRDAVWSNGEQITANDFVRSWKRLKMLGNTVAHYKMLGNIAGMQTKEKEEETEKIEAGLDFLQSHSTNQNLQQIFSKTSSNSNTVQENTNSITPSLDNSQKKIDNVIKSNKLTGIDKKNDETGKQKKSSEAEFGVEAVDDFTLRIRLAKPDKDFPALAASPVLRPIYGDGTEFAGTNLNAGIVTNGAFRIFSVGQDGITLDKAEYYWNRNEIELERVRFIPSENGEKALEAYRAGKIDAVTNTDFEPLALKLLTPFEDFKRETHSAINFYQFNKLSLPFQNRRVREALAISIERERLTEDEMDGASQPAYEFLPFDSKKSVKISQDNEKAKKLLVDAGFPGGVNFPTVKLLINRNNVQQRIARSVAKMWKENLNIDTEITVKETNEIELLKNTADYDLVRRGVVLPTTDETANMWAILDLEVKTAERDLPNSITNDVTTAEKQNLPGSVLNNKNNIVEQETLQSSTEQVFLTEAEALYEFPAIPLYFPTTYSLVKPYIMGFETNNLDAPSLKDVKIDNNWQPKKTDKFQ